jgi:hypothetical protein
MTLKLSLSCTLVQLIELRIVLESCMGRGITNDIEIVLVLYSSPASPEAKGIELRNKVKSPLMNAKGTYVRNISKRSETSVQTPSRKHIVDTLQKYMLIDPTDEMYQD